MAEYRTFMDESGDSNILKINQKFPVFCLTSCTFEKNYYQAYVIPELDNFKMHFWGRTDIVLVSSQIRKHTGDFAIFNDQAIKKEFYTYLDELIAKLDFFIIAVVIKKNLYITKSYGLFYDSYHLALEFIMERLVKTFRKETPEGSCFITAESRGRKEDNDLIYVFNHLQLNGNEYIPTFQNITNLWMAKKDKNLAGLQIADLVAYPIATKILDLQKANPVFDLIKAKICHGPASKNNTIYGYGLKVFP